MEIKPAFATTYRKYDRDDLISQIDPNDQPESFDDGPQGAELL